MALDIITDPLTKKQFSRDTSIAGSTYAPYIVPTGTETTIKTSQIGTQPFKLQEQVPSTSAQGLETFIGSSIDSYAKQRDEEITQLREQQKQGQSAIASIYNKLTNQGERSEDIYKQEGVDRARREVDDLTSQIESEQLANRRQIEELQNKNPQGLFGGGLEQEVNRLNRQSLSKQADLAIIQNAAMRRYDTASAIADRKIQMEFEPLKVQLDALKFFYSENQAQLTRKEDQQLQERIRMDERAYNEKFQAAKTLQDTKLQLLQSAASQGAPIAVQQAIQSATTPEQALLAAGQYAGDILDRQYKQAQIANIQSQISERATAGEGTLNGKPQTQAQATAQGYADRLAQANSTLTSIGGDFTGKFSSLGGYVPNFLKSADRQVYEQAQRNFVTALLRRESGAAISDAEFNTARQQYFPQGGDSMDVVAAKEANRNLVISNFYRESNVNRPSLPEDIIEKDGKIYRVGIDGELEELDI